MVRFLLIAPKPHWDADFAGISGGAEDSVTRVAPIAIATVAAMAPPAGLSITLHDEALAPVDFDAEADFIGIIGVQRKQAPLVNQDPQGRAQQKQAQISLGAGVVDINSDGPAALDPEPRHVRQVEHRCVAVSLQ